MLVSTFPRTRASAWVAFTAGCLSVAGCRGEPFEALRLDAAPFARIATLPIGVNSVPLPPVDTVMVVDTLSAFYPVSAFAVADDGVIAAVSQAVCRLRLIDGASGQTLGSMRICRSAGHEVRAATTVTWTQADELAIYDMSSQEIRTFSRDGTLRGVIKVPVPRAGTVGAAIPVGSTVLVSVAIPYNDSLYNGEGSHPRNLRLYANDSERLLWSALSPPTAVTEGRARYSSAVQLCVQPDRTDAPQFLALSRWAHELFVGTVGDSSEVLRTVHIPDGRLHRSLDPYGVIVAGGPRAVACGTTHGAAMRLIEQVGLIRRDTIDVGVLDIVDLSARSVTRIPAERIPEIARSRFLALDGEGFIYGLRNDGSRSVIVRQQLVTRGSAAFPEKLSRGDTKE